MLVPRTADRRPLHRVPLRSRAALVRRLQPAGAASAGRQLAARRGGPRRRRSSPTASRQAPTAATTVGGQVSTVHQDTSDSDRRRPACTRGRQSAGRRGLPATLLAASSCPGRRSTEQRRRNATDVMLSDTWRVTVDRTAVCHVLRVMPSSHRPPDTRRSCLCRVRRCELSRPALPTSAFCAGVRPAVASTVAAPPDTPTLNALVGPIQFTRPYQTRQDSFIVSGATV